MSQEVKQESAHPVKQSSAKEKIKCKLGNCDKSQLIRALFMILFLVIKWVATIVFYCIVVFQFFFALVKRSPNQHLLDFNQSLSTYLYQIYLYVGYNNETKPFPFSPWPKQ
jgi:hypothetical protein